MGVGLVFVPAAARYEDTKGLCQAAEVCNQVDTILAAKEGNPVVEADILAAAVVGIPAAVVGIPAAAAGILVAEDSQEVPDLLDRAAHCSDPKARTTMAARFQTTQRQNQACSLLVPTRLLLGRRSSKSVRQH